MANKDAFFITETEEKSNLVISTFNYLVSQHGHLGQRCPDNRNYTRLIVKRVCISFCIGVTLQSSNSHPRSRHAEPDVQVTLRPLCLLHNAPAQQGRERRNGWFFVKEFSTETSRRWWKLHVSLAVYIRNPNKEPSITYVH